MKNKRNIFLAFILVALSLLLVSCKKAPNGLEIFVIDASSEKMFVEELDEDKSTIPDLKYWRVNESGIVFAPENNTTTLIPTKVEINEDKTIKTYTFTYKDKTGEKTSTFKQYLIDSESEKKLIDIAVDYDARSIQHDQGYQFDGTGLKFWKIYSNGTKEPVEEDEIKINQDTLYHPRGSESGKKFINLETKLVQIDVVDKTFIIPVRVAGGEKPLHPKTASFWNWLFLQMPIAYAASFFGKITGKSLALAILFTTILVRTLAWPIYAKTNDMSMKMSVAQPDIQKIQDKYAMRKDPESQQRMQMELLSVYKKHNIKPSAILLPFLQMPIFIAMFNVVRRISIPGGKFYQNVTNTKLFGVLDLSHGTGWPNYVFAALVGITMFLLQWLSAKKPSYVKETGRQSMDSQAKQSEQTMKFMSYFMIFMMVMASVASRSLAFYWIVGNLYSIGQTMLNKKLNEAKYERMQDEKLYGKNYDPKKVKKARFTKKGDKND